MSKSKKMESRVWVNTGCGQLTPGTVTRASTNVSDTCQIVLDCGNVVEAVPEAVPCVQQSQGYMDLPSELQRKINQNLILSRLEGERNLAKLQDDVDETLTLIQIMHQYGLDQGDTFDQVLKILDIHQERAGEARDKFHADFGQGKIEFVGELLRRNSVNVAPSNMSLFGTMKSAFQSDADKLREQIKGAFADLASRQFNEAASKYKDIFTTLDKNTAAYLESAKDRSKAQSKCDEYLEELCKNTKFPYRMFQVCQALQPDSKMASQLIDCLLQNRPIVGVNHTISGMFHVCAVHYYTDKDVPQKDWHDILSMLHKFQNIWRKTLTVQTKHEDWRHDVHEAGWHGKKKYTYNIRPYSDGEFYSECFKSYKSFMESCISHKKGRDSRTKSDIPDLDFKTFAKFIFKSLRRVDFKKPWNTTADNLKKFLSRYVKIEEVEEEEKKEKEEEEEDEDEEEDEEEDEDEDEEEDEDEDEEEDEDEDENEKSEE